MSIVTHEPRSACGEETTDPEATADAHAAPARNPKGTLEQTSPDRINVETAEGRTDLANARRFAQKFHSTIRYCPELRAWLQWDGIRWARDDSGGVMRLAKTISDDIWDIARRSNGNDCIRKFAYDTSKKRGLDSMVSLAKSEPGMSIRPGDMDQDPWLLNCPNGTVDLKSGKLRPHRSGDFITRLCPVSFDPDATASAWARFQRDIADGDEQMVSFKQRLFGYFLTGTVGEQVLPIAWGSGANGKSTEIDALVATIGGDYCGTLPRLLLMTTNSDNHPTELTTLFGRRLMVAHETDDGGRLGEALIKQLTGGDRITARGMRQDYWEFAPTHKILLATNHKPEVRGTDHAMWRRLRLIPYTVKFEGGRRDKAMPEKLLAERQGILAWLVRGCLEWQRIGLAEPESVLAATGEYRQSQDTLAEFLQDCCIVNAACRVKAADLYQAYKDWSDRTGEYSVTQRKFGAAMTEREFERSTSNGTWYIGVGLKD